MHEGAMMKRMLVGALGVSLLAVAPDVLAQKGSKAKQAEEQARLQQQQQQPARQARNAVEQPEGKNAKKAIAQADAPAQPAANGKEAGKKLRSEWDLGELKLTRDAVDEAAMPADIKSAAGQAVDWFLSQQEALISDVQKNPQNEPKARQQRAKLEQSFKQRMSAVYDNPALMKELGKQLRAMKKEMEEMCVSADKIFQRLDAVGCTPEQKKKIAPVVADAQKKINNARTKDEKEEAVANYKDARNKVRQNLTAEQKEKLKKKLADEA